MKQYRFYLLQEEADRPTSRQLSECSTSCSTFLLVAVYAHVSYEMNGIYSIFEHHVCGRANYYTLWNQITSGESTTEGHDDSPATFDTILIQHLYANNNIMDIIN